MKTIALSFRLLGLMAVILLFFFTSCKKDETTMPAPQTIVDIVNSNPDFSLLKQAINRAGLTSALSSGSLTVFAPDNAAFAASEITSADIDAIPVSDLASILKYHVLGAKVSSANVPASDTVKSLEGTNLYASKNMNGVFVNGIKVKTADIEASNGVIHVISSVIEEVPTDNIAEIVIGSPDFSILLAAVSRAGLASALMSKGKYTVFAPTNAAFLAAQLDEQAINNTDPAIVASIVKAHVLGTNVFAGDLIQGSTAATLQPGVSLTISTTPPSVKITGSTSPASLIDVIEGVNITATNGVIHVIDRVLLP